MSSPHRLALLAVVVLTGCGPLDQANALIGDSGFQAALSQAKSATSLWSCQQIPSSFDGWLGYPAGPASTIELDKCSVVAASDSSLVGQTCAVSLTIKSNGDGTAEQENTGAVSSGEGHAFAYTSPTDGPAIFLLDNHATGAGCTEDATNALTFEGAHGLEACVFTYIRNSSCGHTGLWKVSSGEWSNP